MTNYSFLTGRLTQDIEVKVSQNGIKYAHILLAVDSKFKDKDGNKKTEFILCTAYRKCAELMEKYCYKGSLVNIVGNLHTYTKVYGNDKKYFTNVIIREFMVLKHPKNREVQVVEDDTIETISSEEMIELSEFDLDDDLPF